MKEHDVIIGALAAGKKKHKEEKGEKHKRHGRVKSVHIEPAENGFIVHVEHHPPEEPTHHIAADTDDLHDLIEEHMGEPNPGEEEAEAGPVAEAEEDKVPAAEEGKVPAAEEA